jgi:hypothetical protein
VNKIPVGDSGTVFVVSICFSPVRKLFIPRHCGSGRPTAFDKQIYAADTTRSYLLVFSCGQNKAEGTDFF